MTEVSLICLGSGLALLCKPLSPINTLLPSDPWEKSMGLIGKGRGKGRGGRLDRHLRRLAMMVINARQLSIWVSSKTNCAFVFVLGR